jgi:DNA-binding protein YbaB
MFKSLGGLGNISSILSNMHNIGPRMKEVTVQMREQRIVGTAGDGAVEVVINGIGEMQEIRVGDEARGHAHLEVWIIEASNIAGASAKREYAQAIQRVATEMNLNLPGLDSLLGSLTGGA